MLGGYQILDLTNINLELGADAVDITDSGVLKQLLNLREYIEKGYDFSRPLNNQLKPFQVRYRDKKADEEITATLWASLLVNDSGFIITASIPNYANLEIFVSFSEETDDDGNNYWVIDTAQVKYSLIPSGGTKLYKHSLLIVGEDEENNEFTSSIDLISYDNEEYTLNKDISQNHIIKVQTCDLPNGNVCYPFIITYAHGLQEFNITGIDEEGTFINAFWALSSITDTVTEL